MRRTALLIFAIFSVACSGSREKHETPDGGPPDSGLAPDHCEDVPEIGSMATREADGTLRIRTAFRPGADTYRPSCAAAADESTGEMRFAYTPTRDEHVTISTMNPASSGAFYVVYVAPRCDGLLELACGAWGETSAFVRAGVPLYLYVDAAWANPGAMLDFTLKAVPTVPVGGTCDPTGVASRCADGASCPPVGAGAGTCADIRAECEPGVPVVDVTPLVSRTQFAASVSAPGTTSHARGSCGGGDTAETVYRVTAPFDMVLGAVFSGEFGHALYVRRGGCRDTATEASCVMYGDVTEIATPRLRAGETAYIVFEGNRSHSASFTVTKIVGNGEPCGLLAHAECADGFTCLGEDHCVPTGR